MFDHYAVTINNFVPIREELSSYELALYQQLLITIKLRARLDEILLQQAVESAKDGKGFDQVPRRTPSQDPETEEHRDDDPPPAV